MLDIVHNGCSCDENTEKLHKYLVKFDGDLSGAFEQEESASAPKPHPLFKRATRTRSCQYLKTTLLSSEQWILTCVSLLVYAELESSPTSYLVRRSIYFMIPCLHRKFEIVP